MNKRGLSMNRFLIVGLFAALVLAPIPLHAQEATVSGTVTDSTGGVLPGVTITATNESTGNTFVAVTDERGGFRLPVRIGSYKVTAELPGFASLTRQGLVLQVGQEAAINLQMVPSTVQESVTVSGDAPLVNVTQSSLAGNIDARQMQDLPVNGRNWVDLAMLAPGNRANSVDEAPVARDSEGFQLNVDGQQITNNISSSSFGQPRFSKDSIAEFEFVANRFDASQGRSLGVQVNAVTKSGTNTMAGSAAGYFRDDRFIAKDFVANRVLPYSNQQTSLTFGGPIKKDRLHYFANFEYEREPHTFTYNTPYPRFNADINDVRTNKTGGVRADWQISSKTRLAVRFNKQTNLQPHDPRFTGGATFTPSGTSGVNRFSKGTLGTLTHVMGNNAVNETQIGYAGYQWHEFVIGTFPTSILPGHAGTPQVAFSNITLGLNHINAPQDIGQDLYTVHDDLTLTFNKNGRHTMKLGGEYGYNWRWLYVCNTCIGALDARLSRAPANVEDLFPNMTDAGTWNLAAISPLVRFASLGVQSVPGRAIEKAPRHEFAGWVQDDWTLTSKLTLNLGVRYDVYDGAYSEKSVLPPLLTTPPKSDLNNFGPRLGFAYSINDRTVLRGGYGKFYGEVPAVAAYFVQAARDTIALQVNNDGRPDFAANPFNGPLPTFAQAAGRLCYQNNFAPGCVIRSASAITSPGLVIPEGMQTSIGVQRQITSVAAVQADYIYTGNRHQLGTYGNINLKFNPATGANVPFNALTASVYPGWAAVSAYFSDVRSNYNALSMAVTKRMTNRWQASGTYLLSQLKDSDVLPHSGFDVVPFSIGRDLGGEYGPATTDQRHRVVFNGIWELGAGFEASGLYFYGSGTRYATTYGGDLRQAQGGFTRLRPNGTIVPRNDFVGRPVHRVDARLQKSVKVAGHVQMSGILEVFNLFNHANYGAYTTQESSAAYGKPAQNLNVAYQPRMMQLGFRVGF